MAVKQSEFKLDFRHAPDKKNSRRAYDLKMIAVESSRNWGHNSYYFERRYNNWVNSTFVGSIYDKYRNMNILGEFWKTLDKQDIDYSSLEFREEAAQPDIRQTIKTQTESLISHGDYATYPEKSTLDGRSVKVFFETLQKVALRTPEYQSMTVNFNKWLTRRTGLVSAFKKYVVYKNKLTHEQHEKYIKVYGEEYAKQNLEKLLTDDLDVQNFAKIVDSQGFRKYLENSRPRKFVAGSTVELKRPYYHKRVQDPYFYLDKQLQKEPRIGVVLKTDVVNNTIGVGSRLLKVMWFLTGRETEIMERCLQLHEETP